MPYTIFDSRPACYTSRPDSFPDMYRLKALCRNSAASTTTKTTTATTTTTTTTSTTTSATKKICCYLDNNRGNYLDDNNSRSSASDSCHSYPPAVWQRSFSQRQFLSRGYKLLSPKQLPSPLHRCMADFSRLIHAPILLYVQVNYIHPPLLHRVNVPRRSVYANHLNQ